MDQVTSYHKGGINWMSEWHVMAQAMAWIEWQNQFLHECKILGHNELVSTALILMENYAYNSVITYALRCLISPVTELFIQKLT